LIFLLLKLVIKLIIVKFDHKIELIIKKLFKNNNFTSISSQVQKDNDVCSHVKDDLVIKH